MHAIDMRLLSSIMRGTQHACVAADMFDRFESLFAPPAIMLYCAADYMTTSRLELIFG